jgi:hypothetical protein
VDRLERQFENEVDFFVLDIDFPDSRTYLDQYAIRIRSTYVLLNAAGEEVMRWSGPLNGDQVTAEIANYLANND